SRGPTLHLAPLRSKLGLSGGRDPCSTLVLVQGTGQLSEIVLLSPRGFVANDIEPSLGSADCHVHEVDRLRGPVSCPRPIRIAAQNEEDNWCFSALRCVDSSCVEARILVRQSSQLVGDGSEGRNRDDIGRLDSHSLQVIKTVLQSSDLVRLQVSTGNRGGLIGPETRIDSVAIGELKAQRFLGVVNAVLEPFDHDPFTCQMIAGTEHWIVATAMHTQRSAHPYLLSFLGKSRPMTGDAIGEGLN